MKRIGQNRSESEGTNNPARVSERSAGVEANQ